MVFTGAGISIPSGMPPVNELTESILRDRFHEDTAERFWPGEHPNEALRPFDFVRQIQQFLRELKSRIDTYKVQRHCDFPATYEEIYYVLLQLQVEQNNWIGNAAVESFERDVRLQAQRILTDAPVWGLPKTYRDLLRKSSIFIEHAIWHELQREATPEGLQLIRFLTESADVSRLDLVTLNHDLLLERFLQEEPTVRCIDGFGEPQDGVRRFDVALFDNEAHVRLVKLHGSLNWFRYKFRRDGQVVADYCIPVTTSEHFTENELAPALFLTGTENKMSSYGFGIYYDMYSVFVRMLKETKLIVMSGYSWNDRGVNSRLFSWLAESPDNRIILLHREPESIRDSNSNMGFKYEDLINGHQLLPIRRWLSETEIGDLLQVLEAVAP